jgi:hypothetical protein
MKVSSEIRVGCIRSFLLRPQRPHIVLVHGEQVACTRWLPGEQLQKARFTRWFSFLQLICRL